MRPTAGARVLLRTCARYATLLGNAGYVSRKGESLLRDHVVAACTVEWARGQIQRAYGHFRCRRPKSGCRETWLSLTFRYYFRARPPQDRSRRKKTRIVSLGRHGRLTKQRQTRRWRRPRFGTSNALPMVSQQTLSAQHTPPPPLSVNSLDWKITRLFAHCRPILTSHPSLLSLPGSRKKSQRPRRARRR